jgi:hypothetical protein
MPYQRKEERRKPEDLTISIPLSPALMELAKELAAEAGMPIRPFLSQALKHILVVYSGKLGRKDRYLPEMTSTNPRRVRVWKQKPAGSGRTGQGQEEAEVEHAGSSARRQQGSQARKKKPSGSVEPRQRSQDRRRGTGGWQDRERGAERRKKGKSGWATRSKYKRGPGRKSWPGGRQAGARARAGRQRGQKPEGGSAG